MEEKIFPKPAVAEVMSKYFVVVWLHYDTGPSIEENKRLQEELTRSSANPIYVIIDTLEGDDPKSPIVLRKKAGLMSADAFLQFLRGHSGNGPPREFEQR
jgi:hypothetical protein